MAEASIVDPSSPETPAFLPLYQQIKVLLTKSLQSGEWKPGEVMPSEVELAVRFKVSQGTVRKAIDEMATENLVVRRQGKGTFVATHAEEKTQYRFLRLVPDAGVGGTTGALSRKLIDCKRMRAPAEVARALELKSGEAAVQLRRLLLAGGEPVVFDDIWLPGNLFKGLTTEKLTGYRGPMYGLFETEFGVRMIRAEEKIRAVAADAEEAQWLGAPHRHAAAQCRTLVLHLPRQAGRAAPRPLSHRASPLSQPAGLVHPQFRVSLLRCNKLSSFHPGSSSTKNTMAEIIKPRPGPMRLTDALQYRLPVAGVVSILHRISGVVMLALLPFVIWLFDNSVTSEVSYERFTSAFVAGIGFVPALPGEAGRAGADVGLPAPRHRRRAPTCGWDMTHSVTKQQGRSSAIATLAASLVLTVLLGGSPVRLVLRSLPRWLPITDRSAWVRRRPLRHARLADAARDRGADGAVHAGAAGATAVRRAAGLRQVVRHLLGTVDEGADLRRHHRARLACLGRRARHLDGLRESRSARVSCCRCSRSSGWSAAPAWAVPGPLEAVTPWQNLPRRKFDVVIVGAGGSGMRGVRCSWRVPASTSPC